MKANSILYQVTLLMATLLFSAVSFAGTAVLKFKVVNEHNLRMPGVEIKVYEGNRLNTQEVVLRGKLKLSLQTGSYYTIEVAHKGYVTKRLIVDTRSETPIYGKHKYDFIVELHPNERYAQMEKADEFLDYPVTQIEFDEDEQRFNYNKTYQFSCAEHKRSVIVENGLFATSDEE